MICLWYVAVATLADQISPVADSALIELSAILAARGQQWLGAYSQFGFHHPGPLEFYWLAPFYEFAGRKSQALSAGAAVLNIGAVAWLVHDVQKTSRALFVMTSAALVIYLLRSPDLLTNAWNPHVLVLPLITFLGIAGTVVGGEYRRLLPLTVFACFVVQAHVGVALVVAIVTAFALLAAYWTAQRDSDLPRFFSALRAAGATAVLLWSMPLAEQLTETPGNLTKLFTYFIDGSRVPMRGFGEVWGPFSSMLTAAFRPNFAVAVGWVYDGDVSAGPTFISVAIISGLAAAMLASRRNERATLAASATLALIATLAGLWSVSRISSAIGDHQIFWLSALGVFDVAICAAAALPERAFAALNERVSAAITAGVIALVVLLGLRQLWVGRHSPPSIEQVAVARVTEMLKGTLIEAGIHRPLIQIDGRVFGVGTGVVLQLVKQGVTFSVDPAVEHFIGRPFAVKGGEDAIVTIAGRELHGELQSRPGNIQAAQYILTFYADVVRLQ